MPKQKSGRAVVTRRSDADHAKVGNFSPANPIPDGTAMMVLVSRTWQMRAISMLGEGGKPGDVSMEVELRSVTKAALRVTCRTQQGCLYIISPGMR